MYELNQIGTRTFYIQSPAKIGVVEVGGGEVVLIDSGSDKDSGRKVRQILDERGWHLRAIYNTHSNADHIGGNAYLERQTGCKIFAPGIERDFTEHPILEPSFLYGGFPPNDIRHKFLLAEKSACLPLDAASLADGIEAIELPGHFFDMAGFRVADDDVVFLADCLSSEATLSKYGITFVYDVKSYLETLERVKNMRAKIFVPAHADATDNIAPLAQTNIDKVNEIAQKILAFCKEPISFEPLLQKLFHAYNLTMNFEQYVLVGSTVRSYLSWLKDAGKIQAEFCDAMLLWKTITINNE